jgi:hypothetical protein
MPLQNRVTPFGDIISTNARGTLMGNRGCLHNNNQQIVKNYESEAWITCCLYYKGQKRKIMSPKKYTELFFLDEATSFSAGHRPCSLCRHQDYLQFKNTWLKANSDNYNIVDSKIQTIDSIIHSERIDKDGNKITYIDNLSFLPDGSFVCLFDDLKTYYLYFNNFLLKWNDSGYSDKITSHINQQVIVLTPKSIVNTFRHGYKPQIHESALNLLNADSSLC